MHVYGVRTTECLFLLSLETTRGWVDVFGYNLIATTHILMDENVFSVGTLEQPQE